MATIYFDYMAHNSRMSGSKKASDYNDMIVIVDELRADTAVSGITVQFNTQTVNVQ